MARNRPVRIWDTRHRPRRDPKFHQIEMLEGVGRSSRALLAIFKRGWVFRRSVIVAGGPRERGGGWGEAMKVYLRVNVRLGAL